MIVAKVTLKNLALSSLVNSSESSSTPLSSSIPSPENSLISTHAYNNHNDLNNKTSNSNNVSTSTSGLSDYVSSAKFRFINESIKTFEKNFNECKNDTNLKIKNSNLHYANENCFNHNNNVNYAEITKVNPNSFQNQNVAVNGSNGHYVIENRISKLKLNEKLNGTNKNLINCDNSFSNSSSRRVISNSIPIMKKNVCKI
jgi:hypothetical protein